MQSASDNIYDIFVSYRSEDIHVVRPVAEHLMANGLRVWFAEYEVLLSGRERFSKAMAHGLSHCSWGVCFTNDRYADSEHCQKELQMLLDRGGPDRIVEIRCPNQPRTYSRFPGLRSAKAFEYSSLVEALRDIQSVTQLDTGFSLVEGQAPVDERHFYSNGIRLHLDFGGWSARKHWFRWFGGGDRRVADYRRSWKGNTLYGHLIVGPMDAARAPVTDNSDDRAYYDRALRFAESFYEVNFRQNPVGVHLSFVPGGVSQSAFTTQFAPGVIARLYSVVLPPSDSGECIELAFFFFFRGTMYGFLRQAYLMDRLVHSLHPEGSAKPTLARRLASHRQGDLGKAVLGGSVARVTELLRQGASPNAATVIASDRRGKKFRSTPLMAAAAEGLTDVVTVLLSYGARVNDADPRGWTALLYAAEQGDETICRLLLDSGADPNVRTAQSGTALMAAALKGHAGIVKLLLERDADSSVRDSSGKSALDLARKYGRSDVVSLLARREG
jgi:hypothetical protein